MILVKNKDKKTLNSFAHDISYKQLENISEFSECICTLVNCAICRKKLNVECLNCHDNCFISLGKCFHLYHGHCIKRYMKLYINCNFYLIKRPFV